MALTITGETILLVEDDRTTAEMVSQMLVLQGYQVLHAANGQEALTLYRRHGASIDLILTDMMMPKMNGDEMIRAVREFDDDVGIIVLTGSPFPDHPSEREQQQQVTSWLRKPPDVAILSAEIRRALGRQTGQPGCCGSGHA